VQRLGVLLGVAGLTWLFGPWVLVLALLCLAHPAVRRWLRPSPDGRVPGRLVARRAAIGGLAVALLAGLVWVLPDGWLPVPPGAGIWMGPDYLGRPATARALAGATRADPTGPLGRDPQVHTAWIGRCGDLEVASGRLYALCGRTLRVVDPGSLHVRSDVALGDGGCAPVLAGDGDRVLVATGRTVRLIGGSTWTVRAVPADGCLADVAVDAAGRLWWTTPTGLVGTLDPATGRTRRLDLQAPVTAGLTPTPSGGVLAVSAQALYRLEARTGGAPAVAWRAAYDGGRRRKPGQPAQGSGTTPVLLDNGWVVIADNAEPRMHLLAVDAATGAERCRVPVFTDGRSATDDGLAAAGTSVLVVNTAGYRSPRSTLLGRAGAPGVSRVDLVGCRVAWTQELSVPSSTPALSRRDGLAYVYAKRPSWAGVSAWYLDALDVRTGRLAWGVRAGTGGWFGNDHAPVVLGPGPAAYVATLAGLVRVTDRAAG
jgi:hypothetical protein